MTNQKVRIKNDKDEVLFECVTFDELKMGLKYKEGTIIDITNYFTNACGVEILYDNETRVREGPISEKILLVLLGPVITKN